MRINLDTITRELIAAGVTQPPAITAAGEIIFADRFDPALVAAVQAVLDAHDPDAEATPDRITRLQLRVFLRFAGVDPAAVDAAIAAMPEGTAAEKLAKIKAQESWESATYIERDDPALAGLAGALELDVDTVFAHAAALS